MNISTPEAFQFRTTWCETDRGHSESRMDLESSLLLRQYLFPDFSGADTWQELVGALREKGFRLAFQGERLALIDRKSGISICTCRHVGFSFRALANVLGKPKVVPSAISPDLDQDTAGVWYKIIG